MSKKPVPPEKAQQLLGSIESRFDRLPNLVTDNEKLEKAKQKKGMRNFVEGCKKYVNGQYEEGSIMVYKSFGINGYEERFKRFTSEVIIKLRELKVKHLQNPFDYFIQQQKQTY